MTTLLGTLRAHRHITLGLKSALIGIFSPHKSAKATNEAPPHRRPQEPAGNIHWHAAPLPLAPLSWLDKPTTLIGTGVPRTDRTAGVALPPASCPAQVRGNGRSISWASVHWESAPRRGLASQPVSRSLGQFRMSAGAFSQAHAFLTRTDRQLEADRTLHQETQRQEQKKPLRFCSRLPSGR